jgi:hypothetical protein
MTSMLDSRHSFKIIPNNAYHLCKTTTTTGTGSGVPSAVISNTPCIPFPERSAGIRTSPSANYMCNIALAHFVVSDMDHSLSSGSGIPPPTSCQHSQPHMSQSTQRQSSTRPAPSQTSQNLYRAPHQDVPESHATSSDPPSAFTTPYASPPPFRQRASYTGLQYPLPHPHPSLHMVHSAPQFTFPRHPGTPGQEANMQHLAYASPSIMTMLGQQAPVFPYQGPSPDPAPSPRHTFMASPALPVYPHSPVNPSPPPHSPLSLQQASTGPSGGVQHSMPYASPGPYTPVGYATPPPYGYPPTSFVPAPPLYGSHFPPPHYPQSYGSPTSQENRGMWWYLPPGAAAANTLEGLQREFRSQSNPGYPSPVPQHEDEPAIQPKAGTSPANPSPTRKQSQSCSGTLSGPTPEATSSSPAVQIENSEGTPLGERKTEWHQKRRSYHPNPPVDRSEWVMWAGNVPSNATCDELRDFFNQPLPPPSSDQTDLRTNPPQVYRGVSSVFPIPRSNCAFINFDSEAQLEAAIVRFHGQPIRPDDPRCPRLVCRIRRRTDDLKAGVGAQRGSAMHVKWVKEQKAKASRKGPDMAGSVEDTGTPPPFLSTLDDDSPGSRQGSLSPRSSRSGSFASTDSGILSRYFPRRYFILKSLTQVACAVHFECDFVQDCLFNSATWI